jgi:hypothetical protein
LSDENFTQILGRLLGNYIQSVISLETPDPVGLPLSWQQGAVENRAPAAAVGSGTASGNSCSASSGAAPTASSNSLSDSSVTKTKTNNENLNGNITG